MQRFNQTKGPHPNVHRGLRGGHQKAPLNATYTLIAIIAGVMHEVA